jgi:hypothetical protein
MCVTNVYVDRYPDGKDVKFRQTSHCPYGKPGRPCKKLSTLENPVRKIQFGESTTEYLMTAHQRSFPNTRPKSPRAESGRKVAGLRSRENLQIDRKLRIKEAEEERMRLRHLEDVEALRREQLAKRQANIAPILGQKPTIAWKALDKYSAISTTISKDNTAGECARKAQLFAEFGQKLKPCIMFNSPAQQISKATSQQSSNDEIPHYRVGVDGHIVNVKPSSQSSIRPTRVHRKERIIIVDSPPTTRTPPHLFQQTFTAPSSSATPLFIDGDDFPRERGRPIIVDERPLERSRVERDRQARIQAQEDEIMKKRLRERQMPKRRFPIGPGKRRRRVLYDDGVYRWE